MSGRPADNGVPSLSAVKRQFTPVPGSEAEIDSTLWLQWKYLKDIEDEARQARETVEVAVRLEITTAQVIAVDGVPVARRITRHIENAAWTDDHFRRIPPKEGGSGANLG